MKIHSLALALAIGAPQSAVAFVSPTTTTTTTTTALSSTLQMRLLRRPATRRAAAVVGEDLLPTTTATATTTATTTPPLSSLNDSNDKKENEMPSMLLNRRGVALSGLQGKALDMADNAFPKAIDIRRVIPEECFEPDTATSLGYLSVSVVLTAICTAGGIAMLGLLNPANPLTWPFWMAYSAVTGTVAMGNWVLAHECGHGAFSKNKTLQDTVGYILHSIMLVPYFSWQRSHAVHHQYTNHLELGETHVPDVDMKEAEEGYSATKARQFLIKTFGAKAGLRTWGVLQLFLHLVVGWPAYLLIGATGGRDRGMTNHFFPDPLTEPNQPKKELFPGNWKEKVYKSDIGVVATIAAAVTWAACRGLPEMMALYGGPLLVVNAWLVTYTWLQHTDVDVPHFSEDNHSFVKGALHTLDRPYDKMDPWGVIDFLHHKIGTTHVAHHFDSSIPHYKAQAATDAIKEAYPDLHLYDPTPIPQALWRVAKGCAAVEKRDNRWIWNNEGIEHLL